MLIYDDVRSSGSGEAQLLRGELAGMATLNGYDGNGFDLKLGSDTVQTDTYETTSNPSDDTIASSAVPVSASVIVTFDPASIGDSAYSSNVISSISGAPYGGTVKLNTTDSVFLNELIVSSLEARNDVAMEINVTQNGVSYTLKIPAGYNLRALLGFDGKIDLQKLIAFFVIPQ